MVQSFVNGHYPKGGAIYENTSGWLDAIEQAEWEREVKHSKETLRMLSVSVLEWLVKLRKRRQTWYERFGVTVGFLREEPRVQAAKEILKGWELINS